MPLPFGPRPRYDVTQFPCFGSNATDGALARPQSPGGAAKTVVPGRKPLVQVAPPSCEVANPMFDAPPLKTPPTWKTDTIVEPKANVSGSTSVRCWLVLLVYGSVLSWMRVAAEAPAPDESANQAAKAVARVARSGHRFLFGKVMPLPPYQSLPDKDVPRYNVTLVPSGAHPLVLARSPRTAQSR